MVRRSAAVFFAYLAVLALTAVLHCGSASAQEAKSFSLELQVRDHSGVARWGEPVTSGVPIPDAAGITSVKSLELVDAAGKPVPVQMRVLSRWGAIADKTRPIRWVLLDFQADVPANGVSTYVLRAADRPRSVSGIQIRDEAESITVATGTAEFRVSKKRFNLFDRVTAGDRTIVQPSQSHGFIVTTMDGKVYSTANIKPKVCVVEESGPMRCVILVRGEFADQNGNKWMGGNTELELRNKPVDPAAIEEFKKKYGKPPWWDYRWSWDTDPEKSLRPLEYTARLTAWQGKAYARLDFTLENNGDRVRYLRAKTIVGLNDVEFRSLCAYLGLALKGEKTAFVEGARVDSFERGCLALNQYHDTKEEKNEAANFTFEVTRDGKTVTRGKRADGWAALSNEQGGLTLAFDYFWQVFPKSIEILNSEVRLGLWPAYAKPDEWGLSKHVFAHGWHKTHSLFFDFHGKAIEVRSAQERAAQFRSPLFAVASPVWHTDSDAWGLITPAGAVAVEDGQLQEAIDRYEQERRSMIDPAVSANLKDMEWMREHITGHYGWQYYGAILRSSPHGCSVLHYDWPYIAWLQFIRTGNRRFLDEGLRMTRHSIDMDQWHLADGPKSGCDGLWQWAGAGTGYPGKRPFHKSHNVGAAQAWTHTWSGGYALGYLLTGNQRYFEALERTLDGSRYFWWKKKKLERGEPVPYDQTRSQGWCILHHLNMYRITGERKWIEDAYKLFSLSLLPSEHKKHDELGDAQEGTGAWPEGKNRNITQTFHIYPIEPCVELHYWAAKAGINTDELTAFLKRWCEYTTTTFYAQPEKTADGKYLPWRNQYQLKLDAKVDPEKATSMYFNVKTCSALAYTGWLLRDKDADISQRYLRIAREMFRDRYLYGSHCWQKWNGPAVPLEPDYRAPINFFDGYLPSHFKVKGWAMGSSQPFLWVLQMRQRSRVQSRR